MKRGQLRKITVSVADVTFRVNVEHLPLELELTAGEPRARVDVFDPLRFTGSYAVDELALRIASPVNLHGGRIRLGRGAAPRLLRVNGDVLQISLQEILGIAARTPLDVPCRRFGLSGDSFFEAPAAIVPAPGRETLGVGQHFVPLYLDAREDDALWVNYSGAFVVEERKPGWVLLSAQWSDGSRLRGWTRRHHAMADFDPPASGWGQGWGESEVCGSSHPRSRSSVTISQRSPIATSPNGPIWAQVTREIRAEAYSHSFDRSDGWIELAAVPGLPAGSCEPHEHLWVRRRHVIEGP